ncbi:DUF1109 domain-containing protein [Mesorhizobium sp. 1M-11]|uniref:NrsF family protein n=1 Tax=Mesorhizobium sp. 1M-11 TaxID=1529006 RepID=UPI001FCE082C|nr:DUF1109 domain-containing protein [Mesorhizobium sp. 1M-11]
METDDLIELLATRHQPIRRLAPPRNRALHWLSIALCSVAAVVVLMSPRDDLAAKLTDTRFLIEEVAALATAVAAAFSAFCLIVPGHSRAVALLPTPSLAIWLGSLGQGCWQAWLNFGDEAWRLSPDWVCLPAIAVVGAIPALTMVVMLRRGAPIAPRLTVILGALAAAALGNVGLRLFHPQDASLMVLVWQFGSVALLSLLAGWGGRQILAWRHVGSA